MQIIPAIDIIQGKCVRLAEGKFSSRTDYHVEPQAMAQQFIRSGAKYLHVVDLEGAKEGRIVNWDSIEKVLLCKKCDIQVGGGIRTDKDIERLLDSGASHVVIGSVAIQSPDTVRVWCKQFGAEKLCIALDVKDGVLMHSGWERGDGIEIVSVVRQMKELGIERFLSTDVRRDGMLAGPNLGLYKELVRMFPDVQWLASGGVRSRDDVRALETTGVAGVVIGKALYEGTLRLEELTGVSC